MVRELVITRDALTHLSLALQDLKFEMDAIQRRSAAKQAAECIALIKTNVVEGNVDKLVDDQTPKVVALFEIKGQLNNIARASGNMIIQGAIQTRARSA